MFFSNLEHQSLPLSVISFIVCFTLFIFRIFCKFYAYQIHAWLIAINILSIFLCKVIYLLIFIRWAGGHTCVSFRPWIFCMQWDMWPFETGGSLSGGRKVTRGVNTGICKTRRIILHNRRKQSPNTLFKILCWNP
jgi:hypothetical protein